MMMNFLDSVFKQAHVSPEVYERSGKFEPHARREALRPMRYGAVKPIAWGC